MFDYGEFMNDYLVKGFYRFSGVEILQDFDLSAFGQIKKQERLFESDDPKERLVFYTQQQKDLLVRLGDQIHQAFFSDLNVNLAFNDLWSRVNENVHDWHSDFTRCSRGFNSSINCYFDDSHEETGGQLQFKYSEHRHHCGEQIPATVYPKKHDIIVLNQNVNFVHRVTPCSVERRMLSFLCAFHDFNPAGAV